MLTIVCSEGVSVIIDAATVQQCATLRDLTEDTSCSTLPLDIPCRIMRKINEYCVRHHEDPPDTSECHKRTDDVDEWDRRFIRTDVNTVITLMNSANYLNCTGLLQLCAKTLANVMKETSVERIRQLFGCQNDFSPEEWARVAQVNAVINFLHKKSESA